MELTSVLFVASSLNPHYPFDSVGASSLTSSIIWETMRLKTVMIVVIVTVATVVGVIFLRWIVVVVLVVAQWYFLISLCIIIRFGM